MRRRARRVLVVTAYALVFCAALPLGLRQLAAALDAQLGWTCPRRPLAWLLVLGGLALMLAAMRALWRDGGGLPVSALPPPRLAHRGPYRHMRHPIYVGFNVALVGWGLAEGSAALTWIVAPVFLPLWVLYALAEERLLLRRFGNRYRHYRRSVGLLPRRAGDELARGAGCALAGRVAGEANVPREGPAILVANHCCYLDPFYVSRATRRPIRFLATAEVFRYPLLGGLISRRGAIPTRRYRTDAAACREMLRVLEDGELVGLFVEGERSVLGAYLGAQPRVARLLARLPYPVVPVGLSGNYDCGPRWAGVLRRRPVGVRVGPPVDWRDRDATAALDAALRALIERDPQPLRLAGLPRERLPRVLWRCPTCFDAVAWCAATLSCLACGARFKPSDDGALVARSGARHTLADLGQRVLRAPERDTLSVVADAWHERNWVGDPRPLTRVGRGTLEVGAEGVSFDGLKVPLLDVRSVSTERADALQVATRESLWQFRLAGGSAFRLEALLTRAAQEHTR